MPDILKDGEVVPDDLADLTICTLEEWQALGDKTDSAVQLEPGDGIEALIPELGKIALVAINFPAFTDGRGFSYARELRERGFEGELRATGHFIRDQLTYLSRVGVNAFQFANESELEGAADSLKDFSEHYQASIDQPKPLFTRRV